MTKEKLEEELKKALIENQMIKKENVILKQQLAKIMICYKEALKNIV